MKDFYDWYDSCKKPAMIACPTCNTFIMADLAKEQPICFNCKKTPEIKYATMEVVNKTMKDKRIGERSPFVGALTLKGDKAHKEMMTILHAARDKVLARHPNAYAGDVELHIDNENISAVIRFEYDDEE